MNIGALDRLITIEYQLETKSSTSGEVTVVWTQLCEAWATRTFPSSMSFNEGTEQNRMTAAIPVEWVIWYRSDVTEKMRVSFDGELFDIKRVNKVGFRDEMLKLVTEKKV